MLHKRIETDTIRDYLALTSVRPEEVNGLLELVGTPPIANRTKLGNLLLRPQVNMDLLRKIGEVDNFLSVFNAELLEQAEIAAKYESYIQKEEETAAKMNKLEAVKLNADFDYRRLTGLSTEAKEKLLKVKPFYLGASQPHQRYYTGGCVGVDGSFGEIVVNY